MKRPDEVTLSREDGEALRKRLDGDTLTAHDRQGLGHVLAWYFWLMFALQEAKFSLKRLRALVFGETPKQRTTKPPAPSAGSRDDAGGAGAAVKKRRSGHGRYGAHAYVGAQHVQCRHEQLAVGQRCPVCGFGRLYAVPPGVEVRIDGNALLSAICYELEKLRCSAYGQVFTSVRPREVGAEKYTARARATLAMRRYHLRVPMYRLAAYQTMVGVPAADATQWEHIERVADCAYPVFEALKRLAAQGDVLYQDDPHVRMVSLIAENRRATSSGGAALERHGMHTTALVAAQGPHPIYLFFSGRAHAGENLAALLPQRQAAQGPLLVLSDALAANATAEEEAFIRCHCLAHGHRKFRELADVFPAECAVVIAALPQVCDHAEVVRSCQLNAGRGRDAGYPTPPHRSRRAALPHRAPASGRDAQALRRIRMQNMG